MSNSQPGFIRRMFRALWDVVNFSRRFVFNVIFVLIMALLIGIAISDTKQVKIAKTTALVLDFSGSLVEQKTYVDPASEYLNQQMGGAPSGTQVLLADALLAIDTATEDDRIKVIVLDLRMFAGGGLNKLTAIGQALERFKRAGKTIIAIGDYYTQNQYYLASYADEISLHPMGAVLIDGYGYYGLYYKDALAKLKVSQHVFRVGQYKSAVEPYIRNDMSEQAKLANKIWMDELWLFYKQQVAARRHMQINNFDESLDDYVRKLKAVEGDLGQYALDNQWVDSLKGREKIHTQLIALVGKNSNNRFNQISYKGYLDSIKAKFVIDNPLIDKVAIVVARGIIMDGFHKAGTVGGDSTAKLLRKARQDKSVKAVVLRVDSPGGSAFASEVIRKQIDALQASGKPVVASMSSVAASGGYWISASADQIWASPTTITGSIGIFGLFMTFENSLKTLGISTDGVATTEMAGVSILRPLHPKMGEMIQMNIERGYQRFISLVANHRHMSETAVDEIAQGRVWTGTQAKALGLVDELGNLEDAVAAAAQLAGLSQYKTKLIEQELSTSDKFYRDLFDSSVEQADINPDNRLSLQQIIATMQQELNILAQFNDPQHSYVLCNHCQVP